MSYLLKLIEKYLSVKEFLSDKFGQGFQLMKSYHRRNLPKHQLFIHSQLKAHLESQPLRDFTFFEQFRDLYWTEYQMQVAERPSGNLHLSELTDWTDRAYWAQKLRQLCLLTAQQSVYSVEYETAHRISESFFPFLEQQEYTRIPAIGIYYHGYFLLRDEEGHFHFPLYKELLFSHTKAFSQEEIRELFLIAINYCVRQVNKGNHDYFEEMHALYQSGLELEVLLENGKISRFTYHNAVAAALQIKAYEWVEQFIIDYQNLLDEPYQESSFHFNMARLEYERQRYDQALSLIHKANFTDILLSLGAKTISLKIYYVLREYDLLDAHLNAMSNFIRRNRVLGYHRKNYQNILRYTKKLLTTNHYDREAISRLREEIRSEQILTERKWFLEQLH